MAHFTDRPKVWQHIPAKKERGDFPRGHCCLDCRKLARGCTSANPRLLSCAGQRSEKN